MDKSTKLIRLIKRIETETKWLIQWLINIQALISIFELSKSQVDQNS